jgi:O-antigen/teichoic acid export membrane protein
VTLPATIDRPARRRLTRTAAAAAQTVGVPVASVLVSLVAVRAAGVDAWGAFVGAMVLVQLCAQVADFGSRDSLVRAFSREPGGVAVAWRRAAASRVPLLIVGPVVFVAAGNDPVAIGLMLAWLLGLFVARLHDGMVAYRRAFGFALGVEVAAVAITLTSVLIEGSALSVTGLLVTFAAMAWLRAILLAWRLGVLRPGPGWRPSRAELRRSWPFFGLTFSGALQSRVDLYVVAVLLPAPLLGTYQVLTGFVLLIQSLAGALAGPIVPALYRLRRAGVLRGTRRLGLAGLAVATAGAAGTWIAMTWLYHLDVDPATMAAAWVAMVPAFWYLSLIHLAFREGDERVVLVATCAGIAVAGVGAAVTIPAAGLTGAMAAAALAQVAILAIHGARTAWRGDRVGMAPAPDLLDGTDVGLTRALSDV